MGTADHEELDFRDYKRVRQMEAAWVRRQVFWWRVRTWVLVLAIILVPCALLFWMIWATW